MPRAVLLAAVAIAVAVAGCGTSDDRSQARAVTERFLDALRAGDGSAACRQLSAAAASELERQTGRSCASAVARLDVDRGAVMDVAVFVTNARAVLRSGETAYLDREPAGWRLTAVGCRFEDGKPRDRPASCELEA